VVHAECLRHREAEVQLLPDPDKTRDVRIMNVLFGRVMVRRLGDHTVLFVPGIFVGNDELAPALFRVDLSSGNQKVIRQGSRVTQEWLVDGAGEVVAEAGRGV
jgi:hypothetical protein